MNVPSQDESAALLPQKRVTTPASSWVRKALAGTCVVAGCAVAAVAYTRAGGSSVANTQSLGLRPQDGPHRLSPRARAVRARAASKAKVREAGVTASLGEYDYATETAHEHASEFDHLSHEEQFQVIADGGSDGSSFHHLNVYHVYPGTEGCELTCEGDQIDEATCKANNMWACEWDAGHCWSSVGSHPCPQTEQDLYDIWDEHYDDYETGMHHDLDGFPDYVYPGTIGCETTCESHDMLENQCASMFYCEWDNDRCWSKVGPNECPATVNAMHDLWYEYQYKNDEVDGIPATPTPSPMPVYTAAPTPTPVIHLHPTPMPTPVVEHLSFTAPDGTVTETETNGVTTVTAPDGTVTKTNPATGVTSITATDGTMTTTAADGTTTTSIVPQPEQPVVDFHQGEATPTPVWTPSFDPNADATNSDASATTATATATDASNPTPLPTVSWDALTVDNAAAASREHGGVTTTVPLDIVNANGVNVATNDGMDIDAANTADAYEKSQLPAGVQVNNLDLEGSSSNAALIHAPAGSVSVNGEIVPTDDGVESSDTEGHHHLEFPHDYPGLVGCEATCEGHGFQQNECEALFFCEWDDGACYSAVGPHTCPNTPEEMHARWLDYDDDGSTNTPSDVLQRQVIEDKEFHNPTYQHPSIPGAWVGYPGVDGCENVCESEAIDEATCGNMFYCIWDQNKCWSGVGPNNCPDTEEEFEWLYKASLGLKE